MDSAIDRLDDLMTVDTAVDRWPELFSRHELMQAARKGALHHVRKGRKRLVTEAWLKAYMASKESGDWPTRGGNQDSNSTGTGSAKKKAARTGIATSMTPEEEELAADLLAQMIMKKPSAVSHH